MDARRNSTDDANFCHGEFLLNREEAFLDRKQKDLWPLRKFVWLRPGFIAPSILNPARKHFSALVSTGEESDIERGREKGEKRKWCWTEMIWMDRSWCVGISQAIFQTEDRAVTCPPPRCNLLPVSTLCSLASSSISLYWSDHRVTHRTI